MNYSETDTDKKHLDSYKLVINGEKVMTGTQSNVRSEMKTQIYINPFRTFKLDVCEKQDYIIAGLTNDIIAKLYKFILKSEEAQEVVLESFRKILYSKSCRWNGYEHGSDYHKRQVRGDITAICDLYNEVYGTTYDTNFEECWKGNSGGSDWEKKEKELKEKGKVKVPMEGIMEYQKMMYPHMLEEVKKTIKKHGKEKCEYSRSKFKMEFPR